MSLEKRLQRPAVIRRGHFVSTSAKREVLPGPKALCPVQSRKCMAGRCWGCRDAQRPVCLLMIPKWGRAFVTLKRPEPGLQVAPRDHRARAVLRSGWRGRAGDRLGADSGRCPAQSTEPEGHQVIAKLADQRDEVRLVFREVSLF